MRNQELSDREVPESRRAPGSPVHAYVLRGMGDAVSARGDAAGDNHADVAFTFTDYQDGAQTGTAWYATGPAARIFFTITTVN